MIALVVQGFAFAAMALLVVTFLLADRREWPQMLSDWSLWLVPFILLVTSELLRRTTSRRLVIVHEQGVTFPEGRGSRSVRWEAIERVVQEPASLRLKLREGGEIDLPAAVAKSPAVREALRAGVNDPKPG
ncbi:uncharacterized protein CMC5_071450 [Chondromyces crocatus]|uniref:Low molecular weight protein antigen 6 PH domain-containing protein n=1 Tax=Chondromyces crocatus TaxID=52 RepID=A0A0K1EQI2_CHOCO|nr:uncharacterized protein CMC5_071450 [Chondromyces crocatus]